MPTLIDIRPQSPIVHRLRWRTNVIRSDDGHETREAVLTKPREFYDLTYLLTETQLRAVRAQLFNNPAADFEIPAWQEETEIAAEVTSDFVDIDGAESTRDWVNTNGQRVYLLRPDGTGEVGAIDPVGGPAITLQSAVSAPFPIGSSIMPLRSVRLTGRQTIHRWQRQLARWQVAWSQDEFVTTWGNGASLTTIASMPVLERCPMVGADDEHVETGIEVSDFDGPFRVARHWDFSDFTRALQWHVADHDDRQYWRLFFDTVIGGQGDFWLSTYRDDLPLASPPTGSDPELTTVDPPDYDTDWFNSLAHKRLALHLVDGTTLYRGITSAVDNGNTQTLTLDSALPGSFAAVDRVAFLERCRLADHAQFQHWGGHQRHSTVGADVRVVQQ